MQSVRVGSARAARAEAGGGGGGGQTACTNQRQAVVPGHPGSVPATGGGAEGGVTPPRRGLRCITT